MSTQEFWAIVERVHLRADGVMTRKCEVLAEELRALRLEELRSFGEHMGEFWRRAYDWDLWAAAWIMCRGCSDDSFTDFRFTLISLGRDLYERALEDADSLADFDYRGESPTFEGYQYVPGKVFEERFKGSESASVDEKEAMPHPKEPRGTGFHEWDLERRLPKLCRKYGHTDANSAVAKERYERLQQRLRKVFRYSIVVNGKREFKEGRLSALMLDTGIVRHERVIPKFAEVREWMRSGRSDVTNAGCEWEPEELDEVFYWEAVMELEKLGFRL